MRISLGVILILATAAVCPAQVTFNEYPLSTGGTGPYYITSGPDGNLWFSEDLQNKIGRITTAGTITEFPTDSHVRGITTGPDGNLWLVEPNANQVVRRTIGGIVTAFPIPTAKACPDSITAGPDGNLWFPETANCVGGPLMTQIGRITTAGVITEFPVPTSGAQPTGITSGPDGNLWFVENAGNNVGRITTAGVVSEFPVPTPICGLFSIAAGSDGNLWFTEGGGNKIGRITVAGIITEFPLPSPGSQPGTITAGVDGNLWFTDETRSQIGQITPAGVITEFPVPTRGSEPFGITLGPDGDLWFTEFLASKIGKATLPCASPTITALAANPNGPCITSPNDGASPQSQFAAISGTGTPRDTLNVLVGGFSVGQVQVDSEGNWEALPYVSLYGSSVTVQVQDQTSSNLSNTITVHPSLAAFLPGPSSPPNSLTALLPLRKADIFVTASDTSPQYFLYGPNYTHAALYLGGDSNGTPLIAEAITAAEAGSLIGTAGQVRSIPLDQSLAWTQSQRISAWHPKPALALSGATRSAIVTWAQNITSQGLPYWTNGDFALIAGADTLYLLNQTHFLPAYLNKIYALTTSTSTFICSTLVWRAYYEGTGHTLDTSHPNLMSAQPVSLMSTFGPGFISLLDQPPVGCTGCAGSVFMVPETLVRTGLLSQIF